MVVVIIICSVVILILIIIIIVICVKHKNNLKRRVITNHVKTNKDATLPTYKTPSPSRRVKPKIDELQYTNTNRFRTSQKHAINSSDVAKNIEEFKQKRLSRKHNRGAYPSNFSFQGTAKTKDAQKIPRPPKLPAPTLSNDPKQPPPAPFLNDSNIKNVLDKQNRNSWVIKEVTAQESTEADKVAESDSTTLTNADPSNTSN